jgi:predicted NBD/HSP70 family sugar kinase
MAARAGVSVHEPFSSAYSKFVALIQSGDSGARKLLDIATEYFATAVCDLVNTLDLDLVVLAGSGFEGIQDAYIEATQRRITETAFMRNVHPINVRLASTSSDTAALGAASVVLHHHLAIHRARPE